MHALSAYCHETGQVLAPEPIHAGHGSHVMTLLRDAAVSALHAAGVRWVASRLRHHSQHPDQAVALAIGPLLAHA